MGVYFLIAARNLLQARRRTLLLGAALSVVSMLLVLLLTLSAGIADTMLRASTLLHAGHVNVAGFYKTRPTGWAPLVTEAAQVRAIVESQTPGIDYVIDRGRGWATLISETQSLQCGVMGIDVAAESRFLSSLSLALEDSYRTEGAHRVVGDLAQLRNKDGVLLFAAQAKRLGVGVGDAITITAEISSGQTNTAVGKVVAVAKDIGVLSNFSAFVHKDLLRELYQLNADTTGNIMVYLKDPAEAKQAMAHLQDVLSSRGFALMEHQAKPFFMKFDGVASEDWTGQKLDLTTWEDELGMMKWSLNALDSISVFLVGVLVMMIVVGITNSMWIAVRERTQEIGTLRAIGMGRRRVLLMFMVEALLLGAVATFLGSGLGAITAIAVDALGLTISVEAVRMILMSDTLHLSVRALQLIAASVSFTAVTGLAALWPAYWAARLQPVTAIHRVG